MNTGRIPEHGNLVLFRADGGPHTGMGHIVRCLALAGALDLPAVFLSRPDEATGEMVRRAGFGYVALEEPGSWSLVVERLQPAVLVVDNYAISGEELAAVKRKLPLLVVIDDLNDRYLPADILINGNITAPDLGYPTDKLLLLGPEYVLLRNCFRGMPRKAVAATARRVLVTAGGGDPGGVTLRVLTRLIGLDLHLKVALGPQFTARPELELWIRNSKPAVRGSEKTAVELLDSPDMAASMLWADLAVSTGGSSLYELCAAGTPTLAITAAQNQVASAKALGERGCLRYLGYHTAVFGGRGGNDRRDGIDLRGAVETLAADPGKRTEMSRRGQELVDGWGADRCARKIKHLMGENHLV